MYNKRMTVSERTERENKEAVDFIVFQTQKQLQDMEIKLKKKKTRIKHLKANNRL